MSDPVSHGAMAEFLQKQALQLLIFTRDGVTKEDGRLFNKGFTIPAELPPLPPSNSSWAVSRSTDSAT